MHDDKEQDDKVIKSGVKKHTFGGVIAHKKWVIQRVDSSLIPRPSHPSVCCMQY